MNRLNARKFPLIQHHYLFDTLANIIVPTISFHKTRCCLFEFCMHFFKITCLCINLLVILKETMIYSMIGSKGVHNSLCIIQFTEVVYLIICWFLSIKKILELGKTREPLPNFIVKKN